MSCSTQALTAETECVVVSVECGSLTLASLTFWGPLFPECFGLWGRQWNMLPPLYPQCLSIMHFISGRTSQTDPSEHIDASLPAS